METWYRFFHKFCANCYFHRISIVDPQNLPHSHPVLYLGIHRNGAVDGFVYHSILPRARFLISSQLRRNSLGKLFFSGIEVVRGKDEGDRGGAARILLKYLEGGRPIDVIPLGITYECPWAFRSNVEVIVGPRISTKLPDSLNPLDRLQEMKRRIRTGLESVGINVESQQYLEMIQRVACFATLEGRYSYHKILKTLEKSYPENLRTTWEALESQSQKKSVLHYQGVPLFPDGSVSRDILALLALAPAVLFAALFNCVPLLTGYWAGKAFPDDRNVISLWRILVGIPFFVINVLVLVVLAVMAHRLGLFCIYCLITFLGLKTYSRTKRLAVALVNNFCRPELKSQALVFRASIRREIAYESGQRD